jgi:hypothetical protein
VFVDGVSNDACPIGKHVQLFGVLDDRYGSSRIMA